MKIIIIAFQVPLRIIIIMIIELHIYEFHWCARCLPSLSSVSTSIVSFSSQILVFFDTLNAYRITETPWNRSNISITPFTASIRPSNENTFLSISLLARNCSAMELICVGGSTPLRAFTSHPIHFHRVRVGNSLSSISWAEPWLICSCGYFLNWFSASILF